MFIKLLDNQELYNTFILSCNKASFLQSYEWGKFQESLGRKIWRLGLYQNDSNSAPLLGTMLIIKHSLLGGFSYLYCPRGPVFKDVPNQDMITSLFLYLKNIVATDCIIFSKVDPSIFWTNISVFEIRNSINHVKSVQPLAELLLKLNFTEEELLDKMHAKTRYNIRLAQKNNLDIRVSAGNKEDCDIFYSLIAETAGRHKIRAYSREYYANIMNVFGKRAKIYTTFSDNNALASHMVIYCGDTAVYMHGGSSLQARNLMAPYLLHWQAIKDAKADGYKYYNFGGIDSVGSNTLVELTKFKTRFVTTGHDLLEDTGIVVNYEKSFDIIYNKWWYSVYKVAKLLNRFIKSYRALN